MRMIAFYLPQYHPVPENDIWWGKGFTEWTNVTRARPLFPGHYQPHIPADLGFYDLRKPEVREAQAELAREAGIEGFCYWHYWFAGKRLLERPFNEVLKSGNPDFPFCLGWANETWKGIGYGASERVLIEQTYPGKEDNERHFLEVLPAFKDSRYMTVEEKPVFIIYQPTSLQKQFIDLWRNLAIKNGFKDIYFLGIDNTQWDYEKAGYDGAIVNDFKNFINNANRKWQITLARSIKRFPHRGIRKIIKQPSLFSYKDYINFGLSSLDPQKEQYPLVMPNWDNTPRSNYYGTVLKGSTPDLFRLQVQEAIYKVERRDPEKQLVFIKSWNEWAEGNYLEPDQKFGKGYLQVIKEIVDKNKI